MDIAHLPHLDRAALARQLSSGAIPVDLRDAVPFGLAHIPGSVHIKVKSPNFIDRVSRFTPDDRPLVLLGETFADIEWTSSELSGGRTIAGYALAGDLDRSGQALDSLPALEPGELYQGQNNGQPVIVLDVREPAEWTEGCIAGALRIPMNEVLDNLDRLSRTQPIAITCAGGQRSSLIASLLRVRGFHNLFNVTGGMKAWVAAGLPTTQP